ncbi:MAG: beta strand repeat-containing protein, partial [Paludibacter sp.]
MKKLITQFRNLKFAGFKTSLFLFLGAMSVVNAFGQVFNENFTGTNLTSTSSSLTYTSNLGTSPATAGSVSLSSGILTIFNGNNATATNNTSGFGYVSASNSGYLTPFNSTLANNYAVTWSFNIRSSRTGAVYATTTASGSYDILAILACDNADPTNASAKGIAVVGIRGSTGTASAYNLIAFSNGVLGLTNINQTQIAKSADFTATQAGHYWAIKVTYVSATNLWTLSTRNDGTGGFVNPGTTGAAWTDVTGTSSVNTNIALSKFGFAWGYGTSTGNNAYFDNFKVAVNVPISVSSNTLSGFIYETGSGPSASQSFDLSATNLTGFPSNITVTGTTNYEVSTDNSTFSGSVNVPYSSATLGATPIYVRLKAGLSVLSYNNEVITTSIGAASGTTVTCSGSVYGTPTTYTWNATGTASIATAANWTPTRTTPQTNDILVFNGGGTVVATDLTSQTIAQLLISNNTSVELQSTTAATLTIAGTTSTDLSVGTGSSLNIAQATNAIAVTVGTGATGSISGNITS